MADVFDVKLLKTEVDQLIGSQLQNDENFAHGANYLQTLLPRSFDGAVNEKEVKRLIRPVGEDRKIRQVLEDREMELLETFGSQFAKMNDQVQQFVSKIQSMNDICNDLSNRIQSNKEKTRDLLRKTTILQTEKKQLQAKEAYLNEFFDKYSLPVDDEHALQASKDGTVTESFFNALKKLMEVIVNVKEAIQVTPDNCSLSEILLTLESKQNSAFDVLYASVQRECRLLNVEFLELKPTLCHSLEVLQSREGQFNAALDEYGNARRGCVVHSFLDALTKGGKNGAQRPIEHLSSDTLRYISDMLAWMHQELEVEKELLSALLKHCQPETVNTLNKRVLASISEGLCQPLKLRVEQSLTREGNCVILYRLSSLFLYYSKTFEPIFGESALLVMSLREMHELASNLFFSNVTATVQRILGNMTVPDYDLLPVTTINQTLLLLRDILESQNDGAFAAVLDKKEMYTKIFAHILDPLNQSIQLISSNLHNHLDIAVYMLNCFNAIKSVIILYQYTDSKLEMIKAQIDANEDVLVSEQASSILTNTGLMEIYHKALAHQPNQGPLSKIAGMETERIAGGLALFNGFLEKPEGFQCHQCAKISSARSRESVQTRTLENVAAAYSVIRDKLADPVNEYPADMHLKSVEEIKEAFDKIAQ